VSGRASNALCPGTEPLPAVVLAAGEGTRLRAASHGRPKPLVPVLGLTLVERVLHALYAGGVRDVVIVTGYRGDEVREHLSRPRSRAPAGIRLRFVHSRDWRLGNGASLLAAEDALPPGGGPFGLLRPLLRAGRMSDADGLVAVAPTRGVPNLDEATLVRCEGDRLEHIGKGISPYDGVDCGFFVFSRSIFAALRRAAAAGRHDLSGGVQALATDGRVLGVPVDGWWIDIDDGQALRAAREHLLSSLPSDSDGVVSRLLNRRASVRLSALLSGTALTPNGATAIAFGLGLVSASLLAAGHQVTGALLAQAASIFDGVDGELARLKKMHTRFGAFLDSILDRISDALIIAGLTWGWYSATGRGWIWALAALALAGSPLSMIVKDRFHLLTGRRYVPVEHERLLANLPSGRDGRLFLVMLGGVTGIVPAAVGAIAALSFTTAIVRIIVLRSELSIPPSSPVPASTAERHAIPGGCRRESGE